MKTDIVYQMTVTGQQCVGFTASALYKAPSAEEIADRDEEGYERDAMGINSELLETSAYDGRMVLDGDSNYLEGTASELIDQAEGYLNTQGWHGGTAQYRVKKGNAIMAALEDAGIDTELLRRDDK